MTVTDAHAPARLALFACGGGRSDELDGVWWPRSRATVDELAVLFTAMEQVGSYSRATLDRTLWVGPPRPFRITGLGRVVRWGGFVAGQDPHRIELFSLIDPFRELLVVPPETSPRIATYLMNPNRLRDASRSPTQLLDDASERMNDCAVVRAPPTLATCHGGGARAWARIAVRTVSASASSIGRRDSIAGIAYDTEAGTEP
ncbi:DUF5994 family protein [Embleya sp. NPDC059259]|uniref:DUF5994 family protein n=1 Tax=unclassified Embleya TaxID=2699296 RepID=UPI00367F929C